MLIWILGEIINPMLCDYIWLGNICDPAVGLPSKSVTSYLNFPLASDFSSIKNLMKELKVILGVNFLPALGMFGGLLLGIEYQSIIKRFGYCPVVLATGGLSCGKTTTLKALLSTMGCNRTGEDKV